MKKTSEHRNKPRPVWSINTCLKNKNIQWSEDNLNNKCYWENWTDMYKQMK